MVAHAERSMWMLGELVKVRCNMCRQSWPCTLIAWTRGHGDPYQVSAPCYACDEGRVRWTGAPWDR